MSSLQFFHNFCFGKREFQVYEEVKIFDISYHGFKKVLYSDETLKLKRLTDAIRGFDVLAIVFDQQIQKVLLSSFTSGLFALLFSFDREW